MTKTYAIKDLSTGAICGTQAVDDTGSPAVLNGQQALLLPTIARAATGYFSAAVPGEGASFQRSFNVSVWGTFVGTVRLERSFDGSTWLPVTTAAGTTLTWTAPFSTVFKEVEAGVVYRLNCTSYTSGPIYYRLSPLQNAAATVDIDFLSGSLDSRCTFTRSTSGFYFDVNGNLAQAAANTPRFDYPPGPTNFIPNSVGAGASAGTPGTNPTGWTVPSAVAGLTKSIAATGTDQATGLPYIDFRYAGTANSAASNSIITFLAGNVVPAAAGQTWTLSQYVTLIAGSLSGVSSLAAEVSERDVAGANLIGTSTVFTPTGTATRFSSTRTLTNAATVWLMGRINLVLTNGAAVDFTLRISGPQLEVGSVANPYVPNASTVPLAGNIPNGLLIEDTRINRIRNPRAEGTTLATATELVTNGDFALNPINASPNTVQNGWQWNVAGGTTTVTYGSGNVSITGDGTNLGTFDTSITTVTGSLYVLSYDIGTNSASVTIGTTQGASNTLNIGSVSAGTGRLAIFVAGATTTWIRFGRSSAGASVIDNVSVTFAGKLPTNWSAFSSGQFAYQVIGTGTECGMPYLDLRFRVNAAGTHGVLAYDNTNAVAVASQIWAYSWYCKLAGGTTANVTGVRTRMVPFDSGSSQLTVQQGVNGGAPNIGCLLNQRTAENLTTPASTASVRMDLVIVTSGAVDITIRLGCPQQENLGGASSPILPTAGTPAATTRGSDILTMTTDSTWFNAAGGTVVVTAQANYLPNPASASARGLTEMRDSTGSNRWLVRIPLSSSNLQPFWVNSAGSPNNSGGAGSQAISAALTPFKWGISFKDGQWNTALNGASGRVNDPGYLPPDLLTWNLGSDSQTAFWNGHLRRARYWPRAMATAELLAATT